MSLWNRSAARRMAAPVLAGDRPAPDARRPAPFCPNSAKKRDRSDLVIGALGVALGLTCAMFPWYIFFNQEKFGVKEFVFDGRGSAATGVAANRQPVNIGQPFRTGEVPRLELDLFPTATVAATDAAPRALPASQQPFPADLVDFRLVHVANGRAMIQDADGLWVVQRGSPLPDASKVASIEQRGGKWVLVTTFDTVLTLDQ